MALLFWLVVGLVLSWRCAAQTQEQRQLLVAAAADLAFAFEEVGARFADSTGCKVAFVFGSTGTLALQIAHGAPFDLFAAAAVNYLEELQKKGLLLSDSQQLYARGRIAVAINKKAGPKPQALADLRACARIAIANPAHAPYGAAARQALQRAGLWDELQPRLVYGENVRQALQFIQSGNAPGGIVALSVAQVPEIAYVLVPDSLYTPLDQAIAIVKTSPCVSEARAFIDFLNGPRGRPIMKQYGFALPGEF